MKASRAHEASLLHTRRLTLACLWALKEHVSVSGRKSLLLNRAQLQAKLSLLRTAFTAWRCATVLLLTGCNRTLWMLQLYFAIHPFLLAFGDQDDVALSLYVLC